jgi:hypothetical protein
MSKPTMKGNNLPSLQKLIVLHLAETEPQTMNETAKAISKHYKPTWTAFKSLEKKNLIKKTTTKVHRKQKYPRYWLTDEGIIIALMEGASPDKLLEQTKILYPNAKTTHCFLEMIPFIHPEVTRMAYSSIKEKGKLGFIKVATLFLSQTAIAMDDETAKKLITILKKYPDKYNILKTKIQEMINQLNQLITE